MDHSSTQHSVNARLSGRIVGFVDHLRLNGFNAGTQECRVLVEHLGIRAPATISQMRREMRSLLATDQSEWRQFDDLFEVYWQASGKSRELTQRTKSPDIRKPPKQAALWNQHFESDADGSGDEVPQLESDTGSETDGSASGRLIAARTSVLQKTDLKHIADPEEIRAAETAALRIARSMRYRLSRRFQPSPTGLRIDLRRTMRSALTYGGEPIKLHRRSKPHRPVRIVLFLDVSGSMKHYSRFFLQFAKGLVCQWMQADAYLIHTRLIRVTDVVRDKNSARAMTRLALMAEGFGGGTRLGESLATFNRHHAKRAVNSRTIAIIVSDGYDTGSPQELSAELARMKRRVRRLVWLNPLLGWKNYEPVTAAMLSAMPHIDHFAAANTLDGLRAIEPQLAAL